LLSKVACPNDRKLFDAEKRIILLIPALGYVLLFALVVVQAIRTAHAPETITTRPLQRWSFKPRSLCRRGRGSHSSP
jgi:hypothetical protein